MVALKYADWTPEMLQNRFEQGFPLISLGDHVAVSPRWAGSGENPNQGRAGKVVQIKSSLQSAFNRDYLVVSVSGDSGFFETWLYTLNLVSRHAFTREEIDVQKLKYISDRVEVVDPTHSKHGRTGVIRAMFERLVYGGCARYEISDDTVSDEINALDTDLEKKIDAGVQSQLSDINGFSQFIRKFAKDFGLANDFSAENIRAFFSIDPAEKEEGFLRRMYETITKAKVTTKLSVEPSYVQRIADLKIQQTFYANDVSVQRIEVFPPNNLWRIQ